MTQDYSSETHLSSTLHDLQAAFHEFKATHDQRLEMLEHQHTPDVLLETKLNRLDEVMTQAQQRLDRLEVQSKRPTLSHESSLTQDTGFQNYLRKGSLTEWERKKLSVSPDSQGGYLVPSAMASEMVKTLEQYAPFRTLARTLTITSDALEMLLDKDTPDVGWAHETAPRPETETPDWARIRISVHEMYARPRCTQQLLDDAQIDVEAWLTQKIADAMAITEHGAFIQGDGIGKPRGFLSYPYAEKGRGAWGQLEALKIGFEALLKTPDVFIDLMHTLKPGHLMGACWLMSRSTVAMVRRLKDKQDQYLWQPSLSLSEPSTLLGFPVHIIDEMPALSPDHPGAVVAFGNFRQGYTVVDRSGLSVLRDPYSAKPYVEFYATRRVGGDVVNFDAIKLIHCAA